MPPEPLTVRHRANLARRYQRLYQKLNLQFWQGRLPAYRLIVCQPMELYGGAVAGETDKKARTITIAGVPLPGGTGLLLHEMVHVATNGAHATRFRAEMQRVYDEYGDRVPLSDTDILAYVFEDPRFQDD